MRFLLDQDVYAVTARFLGDAGHNVVLVAQLSLAQASDEEILRTAQEQNRILVTYVASTALRLKSGAIQTKSAYTDLRKSRALKPACAGFVCVAATSSR